MRPILITGAQGTLGDAFQRTCQSRALATKPVGRNALDVTDRDAVARALDELRPWAVVNAAGYVRVDDAETNRDHCFRANTDGAAVLAEVCAAAGVQLLIFSSDLVFDGRKGEPYVESDSPRPLSVYGWSKYAAEEMVRQRHGGALVIRTSAFFGPWDCHNFAARAMSTLRQGLPARYASDLIVSPTYLPDLVDACLDLLIDGETGLWHLSSGAALSWADAVHATARAAGVCPRKIEAVAADQLQFTAPRPGYSALGTERGLLMPPLDDALARWAAAAS